MLVKLGILESLYIQGRIAEICLSGLGYPNPCKLNEKLLIHENLKISNLEYLKTDSKLLENMNSCIIWWF